ncbi:hypothetical protein MX652_12770 [Thauera aromatica]|nr:hypothetical protein [Thauera aromatica]MCK2127561.1 hypothetical protein [Thauera aromatica]
MNLELTHVVSEDLDFLFREWNQDIDDASLRRTSPVLRSLLIEGLLGKVAQDCKRDLRIMAPAINKVLTESELKQCAYFQAGGAKFKGMEIQATSIVHRVLTDQERKANYERDRKVIGKSYPVKLGAFLRQPSFVVEGVLINREEVVKYVSNKLGGAHYDESRKTSAGTGVTLDDKYALLDKVRTEISVADKNAIYYELLSIGQRIVNSRDVQHLRKHLQTLINRPAVIYA